MIRGAIAVVVALAIMLVTTPANAATAPWLGVRVEAASPASVDSYASWLGAKPKYTSEYVSPWSLSWASKAAKAWSAGSYRVRYNVEMVPPVNQTGLLARGANGAYDSYWIAFGKALVAAHQNNAIVSPGWEPYGCWFRWGLCYMGQDPKVTGPIYAKYFARIVRLLRSVYGQNFWFDWNGGQQASGTVTPAAYPGNAYVDSVSLELYDDQTRGQHWTYAQSQANWEKHLLVLNGVKQFAAARGKQVGLGEWGLWNINATWGSGDDYYFVKQVVKWLNNQHAMFALYFERGATNNNDHRLHGPAFPNSATDYRAAVVGAPTPI